MFFQDAKSSLTKHKSVFWKHLMDPVKHLGCNLLQKKVNSLQPKQFPQKTYLDVREGPKEYQILP